MRASPSSTGGQFSSFQAAPQSYSASSTRESQSSSLSRYAPRRKRSTQRKRLRSSGLRLNRAVRTSRWTSRTLSSE